MYYIYWLLVPVVVILAIIYGIIRYRLHTMRLVLKEEEKILSGQAELLQKEQSKMKEFKAQLADQMQQWKESRKENSEVIDEMQNELLTDMEEHEDVCYWQDPFFNLTFLHKLEECRNMEIELTLEGFPPEGMPVPKARLMELTSLMINLFDNAREACLLISNEEERWIAIRVRKDGDKLFYTMENSCNEKSRQRFGTNTWKGNPEEHGIGLDIINDLVSDMNGWIKSERRDNIYRVEMMIPVGRES